MRMSEEGKRKLMKWEGVALKVYRDSAGLPTIGVGHLLTRDELSSSKIQIGGEFVKYNHGLTEAQVLDLLEDDLYEFEEIVNLWVKVQLEQHQFDALVSFAFNIGARAFADSTLLKKLNAGQYDAIPEQLGRWVYAAGEVSPGLVHRREQEIALWQQA